MEYRNLPYGKPTRKCSFASRAFDVSSSVTLQNDAETEFLCTALANIGNTLNAAFLDCLNILNSACEESRSDLYYRIAFGYQALVMQLQIFLSQSGHFTLKSHDDCIRLHKALRNILKILSRDFSVNSVGDSVNDACSRCVGSSETGNCHHEFWRHDSSPFRESVGGCCYPNRTTESGENRTNGVIR